MEPAGVYVRISSDVLGEGLGVARQEQDCRALAATLGMTVSEVYSDNDVSAYRKKARPGYMQMLDDLASGRVRHVIAWHPDRLHRSPAELERFIDLIEATGATVQTVQTGKIDLSTSSGRLNARIVGGFARYESEHKSERVRRKLLQNAETGKHHGGSRPYGWKEDRVTLDPHEAEGLRQAVNLFLAGHSMRSLVQIMNEAGYRNTLGNPWVHSTLRSTMLRPRNAGLRQHQGKIIGQGQWEPLLDRETWEQVVMRLTDPSKVTNPGKGSRTHLLTVIARCGVCDGPLCAVKGKAYKGVSLPTYKCAAGGCVTRLQHKVDAYVLDVVCTRLARPDALDLIAPPDDTVQQHARAEVERLRSKLDLLAAQFADDEIDGETFKVANSRLRPRLEQARRTLVTSVPSLRALEGIAGEPDAADRFMALDISVKRTIIATLLDVKILPAARGVNLFDPASVQLHWRDVSAGAGPPAGPGGSSAG